MNFVNFYNRFINKFNSIAAFFTDMLNESKKRKFFEDFKLTSARKETFNSLKKVFFALSILLHFNCKRKIRVEINASKFVVFDIINQLIESTD